MAKDLIKIQNGITTDLKELEKEAEKVVNELSKIRDKKIENIGDLKITEHSLNEALKTGETVNNNVVAIKKFLNDAKKPFVDYEKGYKDLKRDTKSNIQQAKIMLGLEKPKEEKIETILQKEIIFTNQLKYEKAIDNINAAIQKNLAPFGNEIVDFLKMNFKNELENKLKSSPIDTLNHQDLGYRVVEIKVPVNKNNNN